MADAPATGSERITYDSYGWIGEGRMNWQEDILEGIEQMPRALIRLFEGAPAPAGDAEAGEADEAQPATCGVRDVMGQVEEALARMLDGLSLQDVCRRSQELRLQRAGSLLYSI